MENKEKNISSDDLWVKAAQSGSVSREELGISSSNSSNGITSLNEGTEKWTFGLDQSKKDKE